MPTRVYAATASTLNFQARLMNAGGAIVPDGTYSVQFKLYNVAAGGTAEWTETQGSVTVKAGYLSVYLGSVTAFPGTIDWSQEHWLTMNVNGDGEMNPRLMLTAVPYAFRAGQADSLKNGSGSIAADALAQLAPAGTQAVNSTVAGLRINQTGSGGLLQLSANGTDIFTVDNTGGAYAKGSLDIDGASLNIGSGTQAGALVLEDGAGNTGTLNFGGSLTGNRTYTLPDASGTICLTTTCAGAANGFVNGGNLFGATATLGTNDNQDLQLETFGNTRLTILKGGNVGIGETNPSALFSVGSGSPFQVDNSGAVTASSLGLASGGLSIGGTTVLTNGRVLQNVTADTGILTSGILGTARGGTGLDGSAAANGQLLIGNGSGFSLATLTNNGGLTITNSAGGIGLSVSYGSTSTSAVRGDTTLTCAAGSGNLTGGGGTITLGSGGSCGTITTNDAVSFATSVTTPTLTSAAGLSITSGGTGDISLDSASNKIAIAGTDTSLQRTGTGSFTIDLNDTGATTLVLNNSGSGAASLNLSDGGLQIAGTTVFSNARGLSNLTGLSSSGTITFSSLNAGGLVKADTSGNLSLAVSGTDYELPLSFGGGLTRTGNSVRLGGNLSAATDIGLNGNNLTFTGSGSSLATLFSGGGLEVRADASAALVVRSTGGTAYFSVNTSGNLVQIGSSTSDATAILSILDSYNNASDPSGTNGAQYYNSSLGKFRCYENSVWKDCISSPTVYSFVDSVADAVVDNNTTNYWDIGAENNNQTPYITLSQASGKAVMGIVTIETRSTGTADIEVTARVERGIGAPPTCNSGTAVGGQPGTFASNTNARKTSTTQFIDVPNTTQTVYYVLCSDVDTVGTTAQITRIRITLQEVNNVN